MSKVETACSFRCDLLVVSANKNFTDFREIWSTDSLQKGYPALLNTVNLLLVAVILYLRATAVSTPRS
jgi:hypothetical protein